jgi:LmbE family N-acetylglucosaminyl deacetylase
MKNIILQKYTLPIILICGLVCLIVLFFTSSIIFKLSHASNTAFSVPQRLLVVFAHTDDEVTNAGLIRYWARLGSEIKILTLTDGSANPHSDLTACQPKETITQCRMRELSFSAQLLGIRHIHTPQLPDSKLMEHLSTATSLVRQELSIFKPDAVLTMEPSGLNHLPDHKAAYLSVARAFSQSPHPSKVFLSVLPPPLSWFLHSRIPEKFKNQIKVFELSEELIQLKVEDALIHKSQAATINGISLGLGPERLFRWIDFETYSIHESAELADVLD